MGTSCIITDDIKRVSNKLFTLCVFTSDVITVLTDMVWTHTGDLENVAILAQYLHNVTVLALLLVTTQR